MSGNISGKLKLSDSLLCLAFLVFTGIAIVSCKQKDSPRFESLEPEKTGLIFANNVENSSDFNILNYLYFYDGGGVSVGDINNDSLPDIYLTANMLPNKLFLNKGNFEFEDITSRAGVSGRAQWTTGTAMADVNGDGLLDIYVSSVNYLSKSGPNQLFINQGDGTFSERAQKYGLDFKGYSKQATFFDYDNDGDLDVYLLNHAVHSKETFTRASKRKEYSPVAGDKLFRNDGGHFADVTKEAGIYSSAIGFGLAATASDINQDGCPDLYVSNDFHENDYLYINNCDGTFREVMQESTGHSSRASMGNDVADFNNDGRPDIFVVDMLPQDEEGLKTSVSSEPYRVYNVQRDFGYQPQLIRNTLQLNMGTLTKGVPLFAEIGQLAGVSATDWSWATLFFDMDNDGNKDLFISNGIYRRPNNLDYLALVRSDRAQQALQRGMNDTTMSLIQQMPHGKIPNVSFRNEGGLNFSNRNEAFGFEEASYSNGAAYGDLDNDGDLDLVINNINSPAAVYRNRTREKDGGNYIKIKLESNNKNTFGIGSKIDIYTNDSHQLYEMMLTRGFLSSVEPVVVAGLDSVSVIDSLTVTWPDQSVETLKKVKANQTITFKKNEAASPGFIENSSQRPDPIFENVSAQFDTLFKHYENTFVDFEKQQLIPHMLSSQGPKMAVGDVNNDGLDDFYIGGARHQSGALFIQEADGSFLRSNRRTFEEDKNYEDVDAVFFDANNDGALDLYVVSGGNEFSPYSGEYQDRLYFNDGTGNFIRVRNALPAMLGNGAVAAPGDFDQDGDMDLFIGNRSVPYNYGYPPKSYLLENNGNGNFSDVTDQIADKLGNIGLVTDATWNDINGDEAPDLVIAGEWMPVTVFSNKNGSFVDQTEEWGLSGSNGWWNTVKAEDMDGDGDIDLLAGNLGLNTPLNASTEEPLLLYVKDFNGDGQLDPVIARTKDGKQYPLASRDELLYQFKYLRSEFRTYDDFAGKTMQQIFGRALKDSIRLFKTKLLRSSYLENDGAGHFTIHPLPRKVQFAPLFAIMTDDVDQNGTIDILTGGNFYKNKPSLGGRYDASFGWYIKNIKGGGFEVANPLESGFFIEGEIRDIKKVKSVGKSSLILVARNNKPLLFFKISKVN